MLIKELKYKKSGDRKLLILRGMRGTGKSTFVKNNNLEGFTLSMDGLRESVLTPVLNEEGFLGINNENNRYIVDLFYQLLDKKLSQGSMVVVDNMNLSPKDIKRLTQMGDEYGYTPYIINFEEDFDTVLKRNNERLNNQSNNYLGDKNILQKHYTTYEQNNKLIFDKYNVADSKDTESISQLIDNQYVDLDEYKEVRVIGDIHGCYTVLREAIPKIKGNTFYIFLGDYIDRGTENYKVVEFLREHGKKDNVVLLEGNHEIHARAYANNFDLGYGKEFKTHTRKEFEDNKASKKDIRQFLNMLKSSFLFSFNNKNYVCTHGGILPYNVSQLSESQKIKGVGGYSYNIDERWEEMTEDSQITQFHGHRNKFNVLSNQYKRSFNLENKVDSGGYLRVATIKGQNIKVDEYKNNVVRGVDKFKEKRDKLNNYEKDVVDENKGTIRQVQVDGKDLKSIVFRTRYLMRNKELNNNIIRGLFYDENTLIRGYNKFYNYNEIGHENIKEQLTFPIIGYKKENGYLGLVSYSNKYGFLYATKSVIVNGNTERVDSGKTRNENAVLLRTMFNNIFSNEQKKIIKNHLLLNNTTLAFEVISKKDKHITKETEDKLVILDSIKNEIEYNVLKHKELETLENDLKQINNRGFHLKEKGKTFKNLKHLMYFMEDDRNTMKVKHEGYVFKDKNGFTFKYKSLYYLYWKEVRKTFQKINKRNQGGSQVQNYLSNFIGKYNLIDSESTNYINKSNQLLGTIYDNIGGYQYDALVPENGRLDIPKVIDKVEQN